MAKHKKILDRIALIKSTRKLTKVMKMVSISHLEKTKKKLNHLNAYSQALYVLFEQLVQNGIATIHSPYFATPKAKGKTLCIAIASDKGLCGAFNHTVLQAVKRYSASQPSQVDFFPIGKKVHAFIKKQGYFCLDKYTVSMQTTQWEQIATLSHSIIEAFAEKQYSKVMVIYQPHSNGNPAVVVQHLPFTRVTPRKDHAVKVLYEPNRQQLISYLIPRVLQVKLYQHILQSQFAEHQCRMLSMSQATDNADDLLKELNIIYNCIRQANITQGIIETAASAML